MDKKIFNIYCDESCVENVDAKYMTIGALLIPREKKQIIVTEIKKIYKKHKINQELKWNKVNSRHLDFYTQIINYFIKNNNLKFRCIVVDKSKIKYEEYHNNDKELAFYKFYYLLLEKKIKNNFSYYIFLDKKPTRDKNRARSLKAFLDSHILFNQSKSKIIHLQAYDSKENILIQLSDLLTGLIAHANNQSIKNTTKFNLTSFFKKQTKTDPAKGTSLKVEKVNIFKWNPATK